MIGTQIEGLIGPQECTNRRLWFAAMGSRTLPAAAAALSMTCVGLLVAAASLLTDYPFLTGQAARYGVAALVLLAAARIVEGRLPVPGPGDLLRMALLAATGLVAFNLCLLGAAAAGDPTIGGLV